MSRLPKLSRQVSLIFSFFLFCASVRAEQITLVADEWCPYNCVPGSSYQGFMIDIAEQIFNKQGITVNYLVIPWARAKLAVRIGHYHGIVGAGREEVPDFIFPKEPLGKAEHTFFTTDQSPLSWEYEGLPSLKKITLGVIRGYSYGSLYEKYILKHRNNRDLIEIVSGESGLQQNIDKLQMGRIDMLIEDRTVFNYYLFQNKIKNTFSSRGLAFKEEVFIAFSPELQKSQQYADILSTGMQALRASGELARILKKYGLEDWH